MTGQLKTIFRKLNFCILDKGLIFPVVSNITVQSHTTIQAMLSATKILGQG